MSLFTSHGEANRVVDTALKVVYTSAWVSGNWGWVSANASGFYAHMWEHHRYATKRYRYIGMTEQAARACQAAMIKLYTREIRFSEWLGSSMGGGWATVTGGHQLLADIEMSRNDDGSWDVYVSVAEDDVRMSIGSSTATHITFSTEADREYDDEKETVITKLPNV